VANVGAQAVGAAFGMTVGALAPDTAPWVIGAAVVVGVIAGMVGRIGPASTGGAVMAVIGVAYTQFGTVSPRRARSPGRTAGRRPWTS